MKFIQLKLGMLIVALYLSACSDKEPHAREEVIRPVRTLTVSMQNAMATREFSGVVDADRKVDLAFRIGGTVVEMPVLEGDRVQANQLLARLDQADLKIQLKAMQADFDRSKAEFLRAKTLLDRDLLSQSDFERVESQYFVAESKLDSAKQELAYSAIRAPFEGYIVKRHVENFSEVAPRTPALTLMDLDSLVVTIEVPESLMIHAQRKDAKPELYATFEGHESSQFLLTLKEIAAQPIPGTQTYSVTFRLPPINNLNVLPGMSAEVSVRPFTENDASSVAYLPTQVVLEDNRGRYVFVAVPQRESKQRNAATIERKNVEVGDVSSFGIQVISGLAEGDEVVTAGMSQIAPGMQVLLMASN